MSTLPPIRKGLAISEDLSHRLQRVQSLFGWPDEAMALFFHTTSSNYYELKHGNREWDGPLRSRLERLTSWLPNHENLDKIRWSQWKPGELDRLMEILGVDRRVLANVVGMRYLQFWTLVDRYEHAYPKSGMELPTDYGRRLAGLRELAREIEGTDHSGRPRDLEDLMDLIFARGHGWIIGVDAVEEE